MLLLLGMSAYGFSQRMYVCEDIQSWTNQNKYGNYTQSITVGSSEADLKLFNCIVANGAATREECSAGRVQIREQEGIVEFPEIPSITTIKLGLVAGSDGREIKLQYLEGNEWIDAVTIDDISKEGKLFVYNLEFDKPTRMRLTQASKTVYLHDIIIIGGDNGCESPNLHFNLTDTVTKFVGDTPFTIEVISDNKTGEIVYSSSNPKVASIDSETGEVNPMSIGITRIHAIQKESEDDGVLYCMANASYILRVTLDGKGLLSVERTFTEFVTYAGGSCSTTFILKGTNLTANVNLELKGKDADNFKLSHTKFVPVNGVVDNEEVTITYSPYVAKEDLAYLSISSYSSDGIEIELVGKAIELHGEGTAEEPFSVSDVKALNNNYASKTKYWVTGFIVGVPTQGNADGHLSMVRIEAPFVGTTTMALADKQFEEDFKKMIGVQLPKGAMRDALNLEENPDNYNKQVSVLGTLEAYFSNAPGVKNLTDFNFGPTTVEKYQASNVKVYTFDSSIHVEMENAANVTVYNLLGKQVYNNNMEAGKNTIHNLKSGVYVVKTQDFVTKVCLCK